MNKSVSVFSNPSEAYKSVENEINRISVIGTAFASGELNRENYKDAVRALNYSYSNLDKLMLDLGKELKGASMFMEATNEDSEIGTLVNNIALAKAAAELAANAIANDMGGVNNVEDALQVPEDDDEEMVEAPEGDDNQLDIVEEGDDNTEEGQEAPEGVDDETVEEGEGEEAGDDIGGTEAGCKTKKVSVHSAKAEITPEQVKAALFGK